MDSTQRYTKLLKQQKLQIRKQLFPYRTRFMDRRIDSYLSLFYEADLFDLEQLCDDLCSVLYTKRPFWCIAYAPKPITTTITYTQLTLF